MKATMKPVLGSIQSRKHADQNQNYRL